MRLMARLALPRTASAEPPTTGETMLTSGMSRTVVSKDCHWSIDLSLCKGGCTMAAATSPGMTPFKVRVTSLGGNS